MTNPMRKKIVYRTDQAAYWFDGRGRLWLSGPREHTLTPSKSVGTRSSFEAGKIEWLHPTKGWRSA